MTHTPTPEEVEALVQEMDGAGHLFTVYTDFRGSAAWILTRFVRREEADRLNVQSVEHVVKLHPETLRALVAGIVAAGHANAPNPDHTADWTVGLTDALLAKLEETK